MRGHVRKADMLRAYDPRVRKHATRKHATCRHATFRHAACNTQHTDARTHGRTGHCGADGKPTAKHRRPSRKNKHSEWLRCGCGDRCTPAPFYVAGFARRTSVACRNASRCTLLPRASRVACHVARCMPVHTVRRRTPRSLGVRSRKRPRSNASATRSPAATPRPLRLRSLSRTTTIFPRRSPTTESRLACIM